MTTTTVDKAALLRAARGEVRRPAADVPMGIRVTAVTAAAVNGGPAAAAPASVEPDDAVSVAAAPVDPAPVDDADTTAAELAPAPPWAGELNDLLAKAGTSPHARTRALGEKVRALVDDLAARVAAEVAEQQVEAEIAELEKQLASRRDRLRQLRRPAAGGPTAESAESTAPAGTAPAAAAVVDPKAVRAWARDNDVDCPAMGRVPQRVIDAWLAATGGDPA